MSYRSQKHLAIRRARKLHRISLRPLLGPSYRLTISESRRFIYVRNPKVATHSMNGWLGGTFDPPPQWHDQAFMPRDTSDWYVFSLVRNPWARIESTWRQKVHNARQPLPFFAPWVDRTFADFVHHLADIDLDTTNAHIRRQTALLPMGSMDFTGRLEESAEALRTISDHLGVGTKAFQQLNASSSPGRVDYRAAYDDETAALLGRLYQADNEAFGYEFDGLVTPLHSSAG